jgi:hypothetical protein
MPRAYAPVLIVVGALLGWPARCSTWLPSWRSRSRLAAAQTGYILAILLVGGTLAHRW